MSEKIDIPCKSGVNAAFFNQTLTLSDNKFALVTGACSGIGLAFSRELAGYGYSLLLISNDEKRLTEAAEKIKIDFTVDVIILCIDLSLEDSAQKIFNFCEENNIILEVIINNAGIFFFRDIVNVRPELIETKINLHVKTPVMLCRLFAGKMIQEKRKGFILNMASISGWMMMPGIALYSSTKSLIRCFSRAMRHEILDKGISITTVCPGAVATGLYNLSSRYMELGVKLAIIMTPEKLAKKALKKMFRRKKEYIPNAFLNRFFIFIVNIMPDVLVRRLKKKIDALYQ